jgi:hypothetical protein
MDNAIIGKNVLVHAVDYIFLRYAAGASSQAIPILFLREREYTGKIIAKGPVLNCMLPILL